MNQLEFKGKVALVTGASRGIGRAIAIELAKNGAAISINYNSDIKSAKETQKLVNKTGVKSEIFKADVSKQKDIKNLIKNTEKKLGPIDLLVTNAGIAMLSKNPLELDYDIWKKTMATNVDGTLLPIKEVLPGMIKRKFGRIVCISSVAGLGMRPNMITYGTSKATVIALVRNLAAAVSAVPATGGTSWPVPPPTSAEQCTGAPKTEPARPSTTISTSSTQRFSPKSPSWLPKPQQVSTPLPSALSITPSWARQELG